MPRSENRKAPGGVPLYLVDGMEHRECVGCKKLIKYEKQVRFCLACTLEMLEEREKWKQKAKGIPYRFPQITYREGWPYRGCPQCNQLFKWQPKVSTCIGCSSSTTKRHRDRKNGIMDSLDREDLRYGARTHDQPRPEHFEDRPMKGLWENITNPRLKEAMVKGDFKAFMQETNY